MQSLRLNEGMPSKPWKPQESVPALRFQMAFSLNNQRVSLMFRLFCSSFFEVRQRSVGRSHLAPAARAVLHGLRDWSPAAESGHRQRGSTSAFECGDEGRGVGVSILGSFCLGVSCGRNAGFQYLRGFSIIKRLYLSLCTFHTMQMRSVSCIVQGTTAPVISCAGPGCPYIHAYLVTQMYMRTPVHNYVTYTHTLHCLTLPCIWLLYITCIEM